MAERTTLSLDRQANQGPARAPSSAGAKVTVYCKFPAGIAIQAYKMIEGSEPVMGGGRRMIQVAEKDGEPIRIYGPAAPRSADGSPVLRHRTVGGYAVTEGVDKETWDRWREDNKDSALVRNELIYATERADDGWAKEHRSTRSGLEPFEQENDPRRPRPRANLSDVAKQTDAEAA